MAPPIRWTPTRPLNLARSIAQMRLKYAVITSVDRDDLRDGGAGHFARFATSCALSPQNAN